MIEIAALMGIVSGMCFIVGVVILLFFLGNISRKSQRREREVQTRMLELQEGTLTAVAKRLEESKRIADALEIIAAKEEK